jgi:uncharacterized protein (TIGR01777 family)
MKTLITGCTGLVGSALVESLFSKGYSIQCLKRNKAQHSDQFWDVADLDPDSQEYQAVIHLAGENVASGRWSEKKKDRILSSRVDGTRELVNYISALPEKPNVFLCASAAGYYGSRGNELLDESSSLGSGFLAEVCKEWEQQTEPLTAMGIRVINLRFGMIMSPHGGALGKMIPVFKMGLGGVVAGGSQYISWISIRDVVSIVDFLIQSEEISGPVNVVSPSPTTNRGLTRALGKALNRPTACGVPEFMAKIILGQMAEEMLLCSSRVSPKVLLEAKYHFIDQSLDEVISYCAGNAK